MAFSDFDGDTRIDFVAPFNRSGIQDDQFVLYRSIAASLWHRRLVGQLQGGAQSLAIGDIDRDGNIDVAASSSELPVIQWFRSPGPSRLLLTAPQVPWDVYTVGLLQDGSINQVQLVDLNADNRLDCFITADGAAYQFYPGTDVKTEWSGSAMFKTDPTGVIGQVDFHDFSFSGYVDVIAPVDREGGTLDQIVLFVR